MTMARRIEAVRTRFGPLWSWLREHGELLARHDVARAASAIAFHAFFSLVPLIAITGWVAHELALSEAELMGPLLEVAPRAVRRLADREFMRLGDDADFVLPPLSVITFLWLSSGGVATAMRVFEHLFGTRRRNWLKRRVLALAFVVAAVIVLAFSTLVALYTVWLSGGAGRLIGLLAPLLALWLLVAAFFRYATKRQDRLRRRGFRGALVTVVLWVVVSFGFSVYVGTLASYSHFYGGLATVVVLLVWLWLMAFALLVGGGVNAYLERRGLADPSV